MSAARWGILLGVVVCVVACAGPAAVRPFPDAPLVDHAPDLRPWGPPPDPRRSTATWDAAEALVFRRAMRVLTAERPRQSVDVNALDEVPDSSFFENRLGVRTLSPRVLALGACTEEMDAGPTPPYRVHEVKPSGVQPGYIIVDARERRYLLKLNGSHQRERNTAADAIVSALLYAAGYHTPCNRVVFFSRDQIQTESGGPSAGDVDALLARVPRSDDGRWRASASAFLGAPALGAWRYTGRWESDANDRVPHELRREVRALRLFFAWVDHVDARSQNTLAYWRPVGPDRGYVVHGLIDFGDALGATVADVRRSRRIGFRTWVDPSTTAEDIFTFGAIPRRWRRAAAPLRAPWGDLASEPFSAEGWTPGYWNGAFELMDESDAAWAARIIARFDEPALRTLVALGRLSSEYVADALVRALLARRDTILERYLTRRAPLAAPQIESGSLCAEDLAVSAGLRVPSGRRARATIRPLSGPSRELRVQQRGSRVCVALPRRARGYHLLDLTVRTPGRDLPGPLRVHLARSEGDWTLRGVERPRPGESR